MNSIGKNDRLLMRSLRALISTLCIGIVAVTSVSVFSGCSGNAQTAANAPANTDNIPRTHSGGKKKMHSAATANSGAEVPK